MRSFAHNLVEGQMPHYHLVEHPTPPPCLVGEANCMQLNTVERKSRFANKQQHHKKVFITQQ